MSTPLSSLLKICLSSFLFITSILFSLSAQDVNLGESLFKTNCASCHYLGPEEKKLIGPGLDAEIFEEHTEDWLIKWIRNSPELIESGDKVANELYEEYNKAAMTAFPNFSDDDIRNILAYIQAGPPEIVSEISASSNEGDDSKSQKIVYIGTKNII